MGQCTKSTRLGLPHTALTTALSNRTRTCPYRPKFSPIRRRPILRALRHSKAYLNT
ncbi:hypothetical protein F383_39209 [Gossypium arboreum]|uniref:Uncharacterized protein n=1 Tax=Gossypium arboreum TaxID=29729 RepID=A0A0B0MKE7_GOSAR|nr:hypothetical protein F383_39209 [Gossypium arboreum]